MNRKIEEVGFQEKYELFQGPEHPLSLERLYYTGVPRLSLVMVVIQGISTFK